MSSDIIARMTDKDRLMAMLAARKKGTIIDAEAVAAAVTRKVIGQDKAINDMARWLRRASAKQETGKPLANFLLAGPPGVGKTYCAKVFAKALSRPFGEYDMSTCMAPEGATTLFGSPAGYEGGRGKLTTFLRDNPEALMLLDELEKAHNDVRRRFLTAWETGYITESKDGSQIPTTKSVWFSTTNEAWEKLIEGSRRMPVETDGFQTFARQTLKDAGWTDDVLDRFTRIFVFDTLDDANTATLLLVTIEDLVENYGLTLADRERDAVEPLDPEIIIRLMDRAERSKASVRTTKRLLDDEIADSVIAVKERGFKRISLAMEGGKVVANGVA